MKTLIETYDGKKYTLKEYFPVIILFVSIITIIINSVIEKGSYEEIFFSSEYNGKVLDIYEERGDVYILLPDKKNKLRIQSFDNYNYSNYSLRDFLKKNDRILKIKDSDTLYIDRDSKRYGYKILTYK